MPETVFNKDFYEQPFSGELERLLVAENATRQIFRYLEFWVEDVLICRIEKTLLTAYWEKGRKFVVSGQINPALYENEASKDGVTVLIFQANYTQKQRVELAYRGAKAVDKSMGFLFEPVDGCQDDDALDCFHLPVEYCDLV
ncbi:MAG: hypothetical protein ACU836_04140 [Gammaproteobacteria bacterium]